MTRTRKQLGKLNITGVVSLFTALAMLSLFTVGVRAIIAANENLSLSKKAGSYGQMYYSLDADGQILLRHVDVLLASAEQAAIEYIYNEGYKQKFYEGIPVDLQEYIVSLYEEHTYIADFWDDTLNKVYLYKALKALNDNMEELYRTLISDKGDGWHSPEINVLPLSNGNVVSQISITATFHGEINFNFHLTAKLDILPPVYTIYIQDGLIFGERDFSVAHYAVTEWRQWETE